MNHNYLPVKDSTFLAWLQNYKTAIAVQGPILGLTAPEILAEQNYCDDMMDAIVLVQTKKDELKSAVTAKKLVRKNQIGSLRLDISRIKIGAAYTTNIGNILGIEGTNEPFDPATYKAEIHVSPFADYIRVKFFKHGADGINLYHRKKGSPTWLFLARVTKSPFDDHIVLAVPNQPEHWEYRAYGVLDDEEIGLPSDIVEILFGG